MDSIKEALTFDDVTLAPNYSEILPSQVNTSINLTSKLNINIPLLSSAMDTVTESPMGIAMAKAGGIGIIHRNLTIDEQIKEIRKVKSKKLLVGAAVGASEKEFTRAKKLLKENLDIIVIDTAHGHTKKVADIIKKIKKLRPKNTAICAGNIATTEAAKFLVKLGVDIIKVGIGPGSICTTRVVTGVGVPQITAVAEVTEALKKKDIPVIADGGIRFSGDIAKAIAAGGHTVMLGSVLAGTEEAPGELELYQGRSYKSYRGMGSIGAMSGDQGSSDRYFQDSAEATEKLVPEGIEGRVPYKGWLQAVIHQMIGGLRQSMGYTGSHDIATMRTKPKFVQITSAGVNESHVHDVSVTKEAPNYRMS